MESTSILDLRKNKGNKDEYAIILDFLPKGYAKSKHPVPVAQALATTTLSLLELRPKPGVNLNIGEKVYIGEGERDKIQMIVKRLSYRNLTGTAQTELEKAVEKLVEEKEQEFVDFFNTAESINIREHQLDLLPGMGKKTLWQILEKRKEKPFESFEDIKERVGVLGDPKKLIVKRILQELMGEEKVYLFARPPPLQHSRRFRRRFPRRH